VLWELCFSVPSAGRGMRMHESFIVHPGKLVEVVAKLQVLRNVDVIGRSRTLVPHNQLTSRTTTLSGECP
jgi:hypothetical protein